MDFKSIDLESMRDAALLRTKVVRVNLTPTELRAMTELAEDLQVWMNEGGSDGATLWRQVRK